MSFADRIRKLASETAIYGISSVVGRLINFILFPLYSHVFATQDYGSASLLYAAFIFLNISYQYGMESAYLKYASIGDGDEERSRIFSTASISLLSTSLAFSALLILMRGNAATLIGLSSDWTHLLYYAAGILLLDTLAIVPFAELRLSNRPWMFAFVRGVNVAINVVLNLVLILKYKMGIEAIFIANISASAATLVLLLPVYGRLFRFSFDSNLWKKLLRFGLPFVPGGLGYALAERVNVMFLSRMDNEAVVRRYSDVIDFAAVDAGSNGAPYAEYLVGVFTGVTKLAVILALVVQMFRYAWQPFFLNHAKDADAPQLFGRVFTLFLSGILFVFLAVCFFADDIVSIPLPKGYTLIQENYWVGLYVVPILLLGYIFQGLYYNFSAGVYIQQKTKYFVYCALAGGMVSLCLNYFLVPHYGMLAAAWATTGAYATMAISLFALISRVYKIPYDIGRVVGVVALATVCFFAWYSVEGLQSMLFESGLILVFVVGLFGLRIVRLSNIRQLLNR